ncbi:MAG: helix-turn-helix transcriptional regulator [Brevibacillus sp.]|nr:helix-turn-helix transcriptional regulator [Brevibacillus sp.]
MRKWLVEMRGELTQEQVAKQIGISRGAYSNIENGKRDPSVSMAKRIASVLGFDWMLFFQDDCVETKQKPA